MNLTGSDHARRRKRGPSQRRERARGDGRGTRHRRTARNRLPRARDVHGADHAHAACDALASGAVVLNDSYNANPASVAAALTSLAEPRRAAARRPRRHARARRRGRRAAPRGRTRAAAAKVAALFLMGTHARGTASGRRAGMAADPFTIETTHDAIADKVRPMRAPARVLVKGSRGADRGGLRLLGRGSG